MNLAIVGSRTFSNYDNFEQHVLDTLKEWDYDVKSIEKIISGGAKGADTLAKMFANNHGIHLVEYLPDWNKHGKAAGIIRNADIVNACDHIIAFPSKNGKGTQNSIQRAQNSVPPKKIKVIFID